MLLTVAFVALLSALAFGIRAPFNARRLIWAVAGGAVAGLMFAYFNVYPASLRGALMLVGLALIAHGLAIRGPFRGGGTTPLSPWVPRVGVGMVVLLVLLALFPYTSWGAKSVDNPVYDELQANQETGQAPTISTAQDVRVVPWDLAAELLKRDYGQDASYLDHNPLLLIRNTYPDTVNGEFIWVHAPAPETAKWLVGGRLANRVLYVKNDADNLTPAVVDGPLNVNLDGIYWQDRVARYAQEHGTLRYQLQDVALQMDDGYHPYWIAYLARLDLKSQPHLEKLIVIDAHTGAETVYDPQDAPPWIELVYPETYVYDWAAYWGEWREGFLYHWFNADRLVQPDDVTVRYIRLENKTYWLLPMRQLASAQLGGYILMDTRTGEATFYDRYTRSLVDYETAYAQLQAIMASGAATQGQGAIRLAVSEGYLYPIRSADGEVREAYVFPMLEGLRISRFAIIDAHDFNSRRVFANTLEDALASFGGDAPAANVTLPETATLLRVDDGTVSGGRALVSLNGTLYRVTLADLAGGARLEPEREMDELELAIARANREEAVDIEVLIDEGRVVDVRYPGVSWG